MSNNKSLLNESTIRRFMKLADMDNLAENYIERSTFTEEEEIEEGYGMPKSDDEEEPMKMKEEEEMGAEEMDAEEMGPEEMDAAPEEGGADEELVQRIVSAIASAVEQETGVPVSVEGAEEEEEVEMPEEEEEVEMEMGGEEPAMRDMMEEENFDNYIAEVTKRVAARILKK